MKRIISACACLVLGIAAFGAWAKPFTGLYVFGDSLSDTGNLYAASNGSIPGSPYFAGRFSNGANYVDILAPRLGLTATPSFLGGTNYAVGGARTASHSINPGFSILAQVNSFVSKPVAADPSALYTVFGGANDLQDAIRASLVSGLASGQGKTLAAVDNIELAIRNLAGDGALSFFVPNAPNLARTPGIIEFGSPGISAIASGLSSLFNTTLSQRLDILQADLGIDITRFDTFAFIDEIATNAGKFGLSNVTSRCYSGAETGFKPGDTICTTPNDYLFFDRIHPSARVHSLFADRAFDALSVPEPATLLLYSVGLLAMFVTVRKST